MAQKRRIFTLVTILLAVTLLFSSILTVFAWTDFTQSRTNEFRGTVEKTDVVLQKYEKNQDGTIISRPVKNAEFMLYRLGFDGSWQQIGGIFTTNASGKITVEKLSSGKYKFVEIRPGFGYEFDQIGGVDVTEYEFEIRPEDAEGIGIVVVEAYNRRRQTSLEITKTVKIDENTILDPDKIAEIMATEFEFTVNFSDGGTYSYRIDGGSSIPLKSGDTLRLKHGQKAVFENLPVGLYYEVFETSNPDFIITSSGSSGSLLPDETACANFTNIYGKPDPKKTKITVKKVVIGEIPDSEKDREFIFYISINGGAKQMFKLKNGESKTFELDSGDTYSITEEDPFGWGYVQTSAVDGMGTACEPDITITYINRYIGDIFVDIDGEKTWDLSQNPGAKLPESIKIELIAGGKVVQTATVKPDADGKWNFHFSAPKYDADGAEIVYTIREVEIPGFVSAVDGFNIENRPVKSITTAPAKVRKTVTGKAPSPHETYEFNIKSLGNAPMPTREKVSITGEGTANFGDIIFQAAGIFRYEISEKIGSTVNCTYDKTVYTMVVEIVELDGELSVKSVIYHKEDGTQIDAPTFTNHYSDDRVPGGGEVAISGTKTWNHGSNPVENQPKSITVKIMDGDKIAASAVITEADHWQWKFILPKFREDGKTEIKYTVDESEIPHYDKVIEGFDLINIHESVRVETTEIGGKKTWEFGDAPADDRPESITIFIKNGDKIVAKIDVSSDDNWAWSATLPKFDEHGKIIKYTVDEANVPHYSHSVNGYDIVNKYVGKDYPGDGPSTGDSSNFGLWLMISATSLVLLICTILFNIYYAKRRNSGTRYR